MAGATLPSTLVQAPCPEKGVKMLQHLEVSRNMNFVRALIHKCETMLYSYLLWRRDVTGICKNKTAKLVEVLHCPLSSL